MHRQSLGSPVSKLHGHGGGGAKEENIAVEDQKRKDQVRSLNDADDEENKTPKAYKSLPRTERFIHLIPILVILCFLILYLSSYDPSRKDFAQFSGFKSSSKLIESTEIDAFGRVSEIEKNDVLAIRSLRNLQEIGIRGPKYQLHRKIGDF